MKLEHMNEDTSPAQNLQYLSEAETGLNLSPVRIHWAVSRH